MRVAPLLRLRGLGVQAYDYGVPPGWPQVEIGEVVRIPFARRTVTGVVVGLGASGEVAPEKLATLIERTEARLSPELLKLATFLAEHYLAPLGACLRAVVPPFLLGGGRVQERRRVAWVFPVEKDREELTVRQREVLAQIPEAGAPVARLVQDLGTTRKLLSTLSERGYLRRAWLPGENEGRVVEPAEDAAGAAGAAGEGVGAAPLELTSGQADAWSRLADLMDSRVFHHAALWGITGSGKTEVYLRLAERALDDGRGVLVLVPEIALTPQTVARFRSRFGDGVAVLHSALAAGARAEEYRRVAAGEARVVVGARSAVTAPVKDLGLVIIDEAHEAAYKQEEEPRYDARTVARRRMEWAGGLLVEGSATPSLETLVRARPVIRLKERPAGARLPDVEVVDLRRQGGEGILAPRVRHALSGAMQRGEQAIVLLNRRGYAGYLQCPSCGEVRMCDRCEMTLTYFRKEGELRCHHCGRRASVPSVCPACGGAALERRTPGTERLTDELRKLVPRTGLFRLDSDTVTSAGRLGAILDEFAQTRPAVLVGTQMVAKGHDFPLVTTVIVADADTGLYLPDFRASERTFQLLTQVAGRAGRKSAPGKVFVQTWNPDAGCIRMALDQRGEAFYREEAALRRRLGYPPFRELVRIVVSGTDEARVARGADYLAGRLLRYLPPEEVRGPARLPRLRGRARRHLLLSLGEGSHGLRVLKAATESLAPRYRKRGLDLMIDVEPQSFL
ncbi:MAG: hypothetical protein Kow00129_01900 [Thermoleophilia bacterium]